MANTTLASTASGLETIDDFVGEYLSGFVGVQDYPSLKAVGRTFAQKAGVMVGFRRSIPKRYAKKGKRRLPAVNSHEPFPVGVTVELHGLHPAIILNGRHVVVVPTPLDVAARGRINVVLDRAVHAVHRENLRAVATP